MAKQVKRIFAFDFDDTLAITSSIIGVKRVNQEGKADQGFVDWVLDNSLDFDSVDGKGTDNQIIWFSSEDFARYEEKVREDLDYLNANSLEDEFDFSKTASIDLDSAAPISPVLDIALQAQNQSGSLVIIITARAGKGTIKSLAGSSVTPTNRDDISKFLQSQGLGVSNANINTAGDSGGNPAAKASIVQSYIERYEPEEIYFYDDNSGNVNAVADLCNDYFPHVKIKTFVVSPDGGVSLARECF